MMSYHGQKIVLLDTGTAKKPSMAAELSVVELVPVELLHDWKLGFGYVVLRRKSAKIQVHNLHHTPGHLLPDI
jgi:hypothetical protein